MDINTVVSFIANAATAILGVGAIWKIAAKRLKPKRPVIESTTPEVITTMQATKPVGVRVMDSIIPLGLILLVSLPLFSGGSVFRLIMVGIVFVVSGLYIFVISTSKS